MATDEKAGGEQKRQVFISYSHDVENAEFVRTLAECLRGEFEIWLDEERISGIDDVDMKIRQAIEESEVGLFVVNRRWLQRDRDFIRFEVAAFGRAGKRRLVVLREPAADEDLGPYFANLKRLEWFAGATEADASFWEVYCGIQGIGPGPRRQWGEKGRRVTAGRFDVALPPVGTGPAPAAEPTPVPAPGPRPAPAKSGRIKLSCGGKPIAVFGGEDCTFLVTDLDEWAGIRSSGDLHPPIGRATEYAAASFTSNGELMVAGYEPMVAVLRGQRWDFIPEEAPVLCFGSSERGDLVGTASGTLGLMNGSRTTSVVRMRDPVTAMARYDGGVVVLGSQGMFGRVEEPLGSRPLQWIETGALGRPLGLFPAEDAREIGVFSATRIGVLNPATGSWAVCPKVFDEGVREVIFLGAQRWPYAVMTDAGGFSLLETSLTGTLPVRLPGAATLVGCATVGWTGSAAAWSSDGRLFQVSPRGVVETIAEKDVVLAWSPHGTDKLQFVRWQREQGATVELLGL